MTSADPTPLSPTPARPAGPSPEAPSHVRGGDADRLGERLRTIARAPVLLVASDYDGTLAPIVDDPSKAKPDRESMIAIRNLAALPNTHVALISGRALSDLAELTGEPEGVHLVGSHGSEFDLDFATSLPPEAADLRDRVLDALNDIAGRHPGAAVEGKPASVALHYRGASEDVADAALREALDGPGSLDGVFVKRGKMVIELAVVSTNKGAALNIVRRRVGASAVLFLGDDVTDEDAFRTLAGPDVGVKVGLAGDTAAGFRVGDTHDVARLIAQLCELRSAWLEGSGAVPIERHAILSDQRTVALLTPDARIVWLCVPRIDSGSIFAELLGGPAAGYFSVRPVDGGDPVDQVYLGDSFHVRTVWPRVTVTDYLDCSGGRTMQRPGRSDLVRVIDGAGRVRIEFAPRLDYGRAHTRLVAKEDGLVVADTVDPIVLRAPGLVWGLIDEGRHQSAVAEVDLASLEGPLILELRYGTGDLRDGVVSEDKRSRQTQRFWSSWAGGLELPAVKPELVRRSALVLKALCHGPSGAIAAAGTTSLPECMGGVRNWDYRYCWPRDAALSAASLVRLGSTTEALRFLDWMLGVVDRLHAPDRLSPIYTVAGEDLPAEAEIGELSGYAGSRPVRVGNAASRQLQLDVFGPIVELIHLLLRSGAPLSAEHWRLVEAMVSAVRTRWREPDHGIWEVRGPMRHHVHSKVMCWQTASLGAEIAEQHHGIPRPDWEKLRDDIAHDVLTKGWHTEVGAFTAAYEEVDADAAALSVGLCGLVNPDDPKLASTVRFVEDELLESNTVFRYRMDDGLPGGEGGFNLCTGWLIEAYALMGRVEDARALFDEYVAQAGPTGLIPEEIDPATRAGLGNHPQAYSHLALINTALRLDLL